MDNKKNISDLYKLGKALSEGLKQSAFTEILQQAKNENQWFSQENIQFTLNELVNSLSKENFKNWLTGYNVQQGAKPKLIGLVLAGNIPLVGLHDIICCLVTGNNVLAKLSHKDQILYKLIKNLLVEIDFIYQERIKFTTEALKNIDAIIATGSNNSSRYFEYYFGKYPNIIRKNRNSIAIIDEDFTTQDYLDLGKDIFTYYGLGCRNVSHLLIPKGFNIEKLFNGLAKFESIMEHNKYANNYNYQKAVLAMNQIPFYDSGYSLFTENLSLNSPIGTVYYSTYNNKSDIEKYIKRNESEIQCIVSKTKYSFKTYSLGMAQKPAWNDYADDIDTIEFLMNL